MRVNEAKKICPTLQTVHVQTIGGELQLCVLPQAAAAPAAIPTADRQGGCCWWWLQVTLLPPQLQGQACQRLAQQPTQPRTILTSRTPLSSPQQMTVTWRGQQQTAAAPKQACSAIAR